MSLITTPFNLTAGVPNKANFPKLINCWHYDDLADGFHDDWVDRVSGTKITNTTDKFDKGPNGVVTTKTGVVVSGKPLVDPSELHLLIVAQYGVITAQDNILFYGDPDQAFTGDDGIFFSTSIDESTVVYAGRGGAHYDTITNSTNAIGTGIGAATMCGYVDFKSTDQQQGSAIIRMSHTLTTPDLVTGVATAGTLEGSGEGTWQNSLLMTDQTVASNCHRIKLLAIFVGENGLDPNDLGAAIRWMHANHGYLYPGFAGF